MSALRWDWWCDTRADYGADYKAGCAACVAADGDPAKAVNPHPPGEAFAQWNLGWNDAL